MPPETEGGLLPSPDTHEDNMTLDPRYRAVCFDMDGTLLDTKVDYVRMSELIYDVFAELGVPEEAMNRSMGFKFNVDEGYAWLRDHGRTDELYGINARVAKGARDIEMERVDEARAFPGGKEMLKTLRARGYKVGVLTRGCREYAETALRIAGVDGCLDCLVARDDYPEEEAKPSPIAMEHTAGLLGLTPDQVLFLGDHKFDYQCAESSGAGFIGVLSGAYREEDWRELSEDIMLLPTVSQLVDLI